MMDKQYKNTMMNCQVRTSEDNFQFDLLRSHIGGTNNAIKLQNEILYHSQHKSSRPLVFWGNITDIHEI